MIELLIHSYGQFDQSVPLEASLWPHFDILFVHEGQLSLRFEKRKTIHLLRGDGVLIYPHTRFEPFGLRNKANASVQHFALADDQEALPRPFDQLVELQQGFFVHRGREDPQMQADIDRAMRLARIESTPEVLTIRKCLLSLIVAEFLYRSSQYRRVHSVSSSVEDVTRWAQEHLERGITVNDLAEYLSLSPNGLRARFRRELDMAPGDFLRRLRLNEARRLLRETNLPIKHISRMVGYSGPIAFHNAFVQSVGVTPNTYRKTESPKG